MKKGFTLVELLAVISILAVIALVAIPTVTKMINDSKEKAYNIQLKEIKNAASDFITEGIIDAGSFSKFCDAIEDKKFSYSVAVDISYDEIFIMVELNFLVQKGYLTGDKIINPKTDKKMAGYVVASCDSTGSIIDMAYQEL